MVEFNSNNLLSCKMIIRALNRNELIVVQEIAHLTWPDTFKDILSKDQIEYMLNWMYELKQLEFQFDNGHLFLLRNMKESPLVLLEFNRIILKKELRKFTKFIFFLLCKEWELGRN